MRDYALVKQNPAFRELMAFPFLKDISFDQIDTINEIDPEWTEGKYYANFTESSINTPASNAEMRAGIYYNEFYDIMIVGCSRPSNSNITIVTGFRDSADTGSINPSESLGGTESMVQYSSFNGVTNKYLYVSQALDNKLPIIGIKLKSNSRALQNQQDQMRQSEIDLKGYPEPAAPVEEQEPEEPVTKSTKKK